MNRVILVGLTKKIKLSKDLKKVMPGAMQIYKRIKFYAEGAASIKTLRWECAWWV